MKFKSLLFTLFILLQFKNSSFSQENLRPLFLEKNKFYIDYIMGPYLFVDHIPYDAVFMNGCRLGFNMKRGFDFSIEYVVGQQQDNMNTLGMTHNVNGQFAYHFLPNAAPFNPYVFAGGGFFEFKAFSTDVYGISYHAGGGTTVKIYERLHGVIEARYLNLGLMDLGGQHELAVFWGARFAF